MKVTPKKIDISSQLKEYNQLIANQSYFTLKEVRAINLPYHWLIVLGEKNIGKTYQLYQLVKELKPGEKFVYLRITVKECDEMAKSWLADQNCPFMVIGKYIYWKVRDKKGDIIRPTAKEIIGRIVAISSRQSVASSFDSSYVFAFFDEFIPLTPKKIYEISAFDLMMLYSNISRRNQKFQFYFFGNYNGDSDILKFLEINPATEMAYDQFVVDMENQEPTKEFNILFINTLGKFGGIESQLGMAILKVKNPNLYHKLTKNRPINESEIVIHDSTIVKLFIPKFYVVLPMVGERSYGGRNNTIYVYRQLVYQDEMLRWQRAHMLSIDYEINQPDCPILTPAIDIANLYNYRFIPLKDLVAMLEPIFTIAMARRLFLNSNRSLTNLLADLGINLRHWT